MLRRLPLALSTTLLAAALAASEPATVWSMPALDQSPSPMDRRALSPAPAGSHGRIAIRDGRLMAGDERVRLWGTNICGDGAFPEPALAKGIAARLAKLGVNAVRFHHLEASWVPRNIFGKRENWKDTRTIDPESLDRLDRLAAELKANGIWIDINLLVSRRFVAADGLPAEVEAMNWKDVHTVGFWDERIQALQRDYARQLLTHVNPYTGIAWGQDPAVAIVEINNENGLTMPFFENKLHQMPEVFRAGLRQRWNTWLKARYRDSAAMHAGWSGAAEPLGDELLKPLTDPLWRATAQMGTEVAHRIQADGTYELIITKGGTAGWMNELVFSPLHLDKGRPYTVSFTASASATAEGKPRYARVNVSLNRGPWTPVGLEATIELTEQPRRFDYTFEAGATDDDLRFLVTDLGQHGAVFRFRDISLRRGGQIRVDPAVGLDAGVPLVGEGTMARVTTACRRDHVEFLEAQERTYWDGLAGFLKDELKTPAIILPTIVGVASPRQMARYGIIDTHHYWAHPQWGGDWAREWTVDPASMVTSDNADPLSQLAMKRVLGLPHLVTEYNHCIPNPHAGEGPLMLAAYASLQDWDGVFYFSYNGQDLSWQSGAINLQFDVVNHPTVMASFPWAATVFRQGLVQPAKQLVARPMDATTAIDLLATQGQAWSSVNLHNLGIDPQTALVHRTALLLNGLNGLDGQPASGESISGTTQDLIADTGELRWIRTGDRGFLVDTAKAKAYVGNAATTTWAGGFTFTRTATDPWHQLALVSLDGKPLGSAGSKALLLLTGTASQTGMRYNAARTSVTDQWGTGPTLVEEIAGTMTVPAGVRIRSLDATGQPQRAMNGEPSANGMRFTTGASGGIWWLLEW